MARSIDSILKVLESLEAICGTLMQVISTGSYSSDELLVLRDRLATTVRQVSQRKNKVLW
jgi:hypothetical protein